MPLTISNSIETENAIYIVGYEHHTLLQHDKVLQKNLDGVLLEGNISLDVGYVNSRMGVSNKKPPVFLADIARAKTRTSTQIKEMIQGLPREFLVAFLVREAYLFSKQKIPAVQKMQSKAGNFLDRWFASKKIQDYFRGVRKKELQMDPARRKFLKSAAAFLLFSLSEGVDPLFGRQIPATRSLSERLDRFFGNFKIAGRNAVIAERLETFIAPMLRTEIGRKPVIGLVMGLNHKGIETELKDSALRRETLLRFQGELAKLNTVSKQIGVYRFNSVKRVYEKDKFIEVSSFVPKKAGSRFPARRLEDVQFTRRDVLRGTFMRRPRRA